MMMSGKDFVKSLALIKLYLSYLPSNNKLGYTANLYGNGSQKTESLSTSRQPPLKPTSPLSSHHFLHSYFMHIN